MQVCYKAIHVMNVKKTENFCRFYSVPLNYTNVIRLVTMISTVPVPIDKNTASKVMITVNVYHNKQCSMLSALKFEMMPLTTMLDICSRINVNLIMFQASTVSTSAKRGTFELM